MKRILTLFLCLSVIYSCSKRLVFVSSAKRQKILSESGFIPNKDTIMNSTRPELSQYNIKNGCNIADIGFSTGWFEGVLELTYDSINVNAVEISNYYIRRLKIVVDGYSDLRAYKSDNKINAIKGTINKTNLKPNSMDLVLMRETFHHVSRKNEILKDIYDILKPEGRLIIHEPYSDSTYYSKLCNSEIIDKAGIVEILKLNQFKLIEETRITRKPGNVPSWWNAENVEGIILTFSK